MNINAISGNYYNAKSVKSYTSSPNFRGELSDVQVKRALKMLKPQVTCVQPCSDMNEVKNILSTLMQKYEGLGLSTKSAGMMVIPAEELAEFLGEKGSKYNLNDLIGICAAVGDKYGPVESWTKAYEGIVALLPKSVFK